MYAFTPQDLLLGSYSSAHIKLHEMGPSLESIGAVVKEIMRINSSLPARHSIDEVEAAMTLVRNVEREEQSRIEALAKQKKGNEVPEELCFILKEMQKNLMQFQCKEQKREALKLLDLENVHMLFDELIQRASSCLPSAPKGLITSNSISLSSMNSKRMTISDAKENFSSTMNYVTNATNKHRITRDDSYVTNAKSVHLHERSADINAHQGLLLHTAPSNRTSEFFEEEDCQKLSLFNLASLIEIFAKKSSQNLNLQKKLMDQIDWIPDSIGKLTALETLDLSENHIIALPTTIGALTSLTKLDLQFNQIAGLPDSIGDLFNLLYLNLSGNQLTMLPSSIGKLYRLEELDCSCNQISLLPDTIGDLVSLKKLNVETNSMEEFPYTIGNCVSLTELKVDYNRLKALPEAIGKLESLQVLKLRYNNLKSLPTTMGTLLKLREIDASFNELESIPESLCLATSLTKLNIGNNFASLQFLPQSIGNLEILEELDMSNNQIKILPDSFGMLSRLRVLHAEENPLEIPPMLIAEQGAKVVVQYMAELVNKREIESQSSKGALANCCFFPTPNKRKSDGWDHVT
ncbi:hypothetical protein HPP92_022431 [Vanilla planifolia]|uniref:Disease resistance R13L4/SHOC-2-like LRR domain-containing protein n=1 Tax=Vanilla planifolia TaxID=51239 RepID=A0A835PY85_VANPL|nr:hypothetical protein HPP92_022431 [Vanilla planifolia]